MATEDKSMVCNCEQLARIIDGCGFSKDRAVVVRLAGSYSAAEIFVCAFKALYLKSK